MARWLILRMCKLIGCNDVGVLRGKRREFYAQVSALKACISTRSMHRSYPLLDSPQLVCGASECFQVWKLYASPSVSVCTWARLLARAIQYAGSKGVAAISMGLTCKLAFSISRAVTVHYRRED